MDTITMIEIFVFGFVIIWFVGYFIYDIVTKYFSSCKANSTSGTVCQKSCECQSGACGLSDDLTNTATCCPTSQVTTDSNGLTYCAGYANGNKCAIDGMCSSGSCMNGICAPKSTTCANGMGFLNALPGAPIVCCDPNKVVTINGYQYCDNAANGTPCLGNTECSSGFCNGADGSGTIGTCSTKGSSPTPVLNPCKYNSDCPLGACGRWGNTNTDYVCCPSGKTRTWLHDWCTELPSGTTCVENSLCASGVCNNGVCQ